MHFPFVLLTESSRFPSLLSFPRLVQPLRPTHVLYLYSTMASHFHALFRPFSSQNPSAFMFPWSCFCLRQFFKPIPVLLYLQLFSKPRPCTFRPFPLQNPPAFPSLLSFLPSTVPNTHPSSLFTFSCVANHSQTLSVCSTQSTPPRFLSRLRLPYLKLLSKIIILHHA